VSRNPATSGSAHTEFEIDLHLVHRFEHEATPRHAEFRMAADLTDVTTQDIYAAPGGPATYRPEWSLID
jgi:hypothetical protein